MLPGYGHDGRLELQILLDSACEDLDGDFLVERGADDLEEAFELLLLVLGSLGCDQVEADFVLSILWKIHIFHGRVGNIDLLLEAALLLADL